MPRLLARTDGISHHSILASFEQRGMPSPCARIPKRTIFGNQRRDGVIAVENQLQAALARQIDAVRSAAPQDVAKIEAAAELVPELVHELGLGQFLKPLLVDHKPRLLLHFRLRGHSPTRSLGEEIVLKVYGDQPRGEGPLQSVWRSRGLNVPKLRYGYRSGCSWLVLEYLKLYPLRLSSAEDFSKVTEELARLGLVMHESLPGICPFLRPLASVMFPRWESAVETLRAAGRHIPRRWRETANAAYQSGAPRPLHGDLAVTNIARDSSSRLIIFDASALLGSVAFEAARWAARSASINASPDQLFSLWGDIEQGDPGARSDELLAAECILEAGSREIIVSGAQRTSEDNVFQGDATSSEHLLTLAGALLS